MGLFGLTKKEKSVWAGIKVGSKVKLFLANDFDTYRTKVKEVSSVYMEVSTPVVGNAFLEVREKTKVKVEVEVYAVNIAKMEFFSRVERHNWGREQTILLVCPRSIKYMNLRMCYRVEAKGVEGEFSFSEESSSKGIEPRHPVFSAQVKNISQGGALLMAEKLLAIQKGALVNVRIRLQAGILIRGICKVIRIEPVQKKYGVAVEFLRMNEGDRKQLSLFIEKVRE